MGKPTDDRSGVLAFIHDMLGQLRRMAEVERHEMLAYLIEMAYIESGDLTHRDHSSQIMKYKRDGTS